MYTNHVFKGQTGILYRPFENSGIHPLEKAYNEVYWQNQTLREIIYNRDDQLLIERKQHRFQLEQERLKHAKRLLSYQQYVEFLDRKRRQLENILANFEMLSKRSIKDIRSLAQENKKLKRLLNTFDEKTTKAAAVSEKATETKLEKVQLTPSNKCKAKDELLQEAEIENRQLKVDKDILTYKITGYEQEIKKLNTHVEMLARDKSELVTRTRSRSSQVKSDPQQCQTCNKYKKDISDLRNEINGLRDRLSEAAGNKLRDNNPNIADLSDMNRPTSLAEKLSSLYTDAYTDAMEVITDNMSEADCAGTMLQWLKSCYDCCDKLATEQKSVLSKHAIGFMQKYLGQYDDLVVPVKNIHVKEFQKKIAADSLIAVEKICRLESLKQESLLNDNRIVKYIKKCSELCWMMQISDPPLYLQFDIKHGENLDRNSYNIFTNSGNKVDFLVWPVLYLHKTGPMLAKGIAQGM